jgi:hypothetical protein
MLGREVRGQLRRFRYGSGDERRIHHPLLGTITF